MKRSLTLAPTGAFSILKWEKRLAWRLNVGRRSCLQALKGTDSGAYFHTVELIVGLVKVSVRAGFVKDFSLPYGLLGQAGFFDHFVITMSRSGTPPYIMVEPLQ